MIHAQMIHAQMIHAQMIHAQIIHTQMFNGQMIESWNGINVGRILLLLYSQLSWHEINIVLYHELQYSKNYYAI